ncbi:glycosyltransferase family 39 protein [Singulisphaera sp. Ch08]|uniref:Glycosyltransferase family 39 protein n=1 Tax=Singulisphaera sp. Ch08 TaxID=3120278 RepID=A0AAU7C9W7_9BACT
MVRIRPQELGSAHSREFPGANGGQSTRSGTRLDVAVAGLLVVGVLLLLLVTMDDFGMTWDEGFTVEREERLKEWFARVVGANSRGVQAWSPPTSNLESRRDYLKRAGARAASPWSRDSLRFFWPFAREEPNGHPPFYALLGLGGWAVGHSFLPPLESYRCGPAIFFALTIGVIYGFMARLYGRSAGLTAALALLTMPRVFAQAHLASYDAPLLCLWFLAVVAFCRSEEPSRRRWGWILAFGMAWGCAAATKFTGWFVSVPLVAWGLLYRDRQAAFTLLAGDWWPPSSFMPSTLRGGSSRSKVCGFFSSPTWAGSNDLRFPPSFLGRFIPSRFLGTTRWPGRRSSSRRSFS